MYQKYEKIVNVFLYTNVFKHHLGTKHWTMNIKYLCVNHNYNIIQCLNQEKLLWLQTKT